MQTTFSNYPNLKAARYWQGIDGVMRHNRLKTSFLLLHTSQMAALGV
jgi:hypothetical protein